jgi:hypothetical protein
MQPERLVHPCSSTGLCPPAAEEGVNALGSWNAGARGDASVERLVAAATSGSPVLKHGPLPPAAEGGRKRPRLLERGGAGRRECGTRCAGPRECGTFGCSSNVWFTRAQARAYAACGGGGRERPRLLERGGAGRRECGTRQRGATRVWNADARGSASVERLVAAATAGSPVLKHGPMPPAAEEGVNALGFWNADARQRENGTLVRRHLPTTRSSMYRTSFGFSPELVYTQSPASVRSGFFQHQFRARTFGFFSRQPERTPGRTSSYDCESRR